MNYHPNLDQYDLIYGALPDDQGELISYLEESLQLNRTKILEAEKTIQSIEWRDRDYTFYIVPKGTPRPRAGGRHFYVKGAAQLKRVFKQALQDDGIICTRCEYHLKAYLPTPISSMNRMEILMAEKGLIRPLVTPDWDNLAKTYTDCLQSVILLNDDLINPGSVEKFYSIKPRIEIHLRYQTQFDSKYNEKKTLNSKVYKELTKGDRHE